MNVESALKFVIMHLPKSGFSSTRFFSKEFPSLKNITVFSLQKLTIRLFCFIFLESFVVITMKSAWRIKNLKKKKCARVLASSLITLIVGFQNPGSYSIFRVTCGRSLQPSFLGSWKFLSTNKRVQTKAISEQKYSSIHLIYFINECIVLSWKGDNNKWKNSISTRKIGNRKQRPWKRVHFIKDQSRIIRVDISVKFQSPIITIMHWFPDNSYTQ